MELLDSYVVDALEADFEQRFRDEAQRAKIASALYTWLANVARKKPLPDLDQRLKDFKVEIDRAVENMEVRIVDGKWVVKVAGSAESTLKKLRLGTDWFVGTDDVLELVLTGLFDM